MIMNGERLGFGRRRSQSIWRQSLWSSFIWMGYVEAKCVVTLLNDEYRKVGKRRNFRYCVFKLDAPCLLKRFPYWASCLILKLLTKLITW